MVTFLKKIWPAASPAKEAAADLYLRVVEKARDPAFYRSLGVPDTVDGRFDMIVIHATLLIRRLRQGGAEGQAVAQELFDRMFQDFDRSLRELGVGDMSVGKQIKKMGKAFYGRAASYEAGLDAASTDDASSLREAIRTTVFRQRAEPHGIDAMADYLQRATANLSTQPIAVMIQGGVDLKTVV